MFDQQGNKAYLNEFGRRLLHLDHELRVEGTWVQQVASFIKPAQDEATSGRTSTPRRRRSPSGIKDMSELVSGGADFRRRMAAFEELFLAVLGAGTAASSPSPAVASH